MPRPHVALAVAVAFVWGLNFVVIHVGLEDLPPLLFAALRFTFVAFPAVLLVRRPPIALRWLVLVGLFLSGIQFGLLFVAMDLGLPAGLASLIVQLQAVFTLGLAVGLLGERPGPERWAGAGVALAGIGVIAAGRAEDVPLLGVVLAVGAAASWGVGNIVTRLARAPEPLPLVVWSALVAPVPLLALSLAFEGPQEIGAAVRGVGPEGLLALAYVVVLASLFGYGAWTWLLQQHEASRVAPFSLLVPVFGIASAWTLLAERPNAAELAGCLLVLAGLAVGSGVLQLEQRRDDGRRPGEGLVDRDVEEGLGGLRRIGPLEARDRGGGASGDGGGHAPSVGTPR